VKKAKTPANSVVKKAKTPGKPSPSIDQISSGLHNDIVGTIALENIKKQGLPPKLQAEAIADVLKKRARQRARENRRAD